MLFLILSYLLLVLVLPAALSAVVSYRTIPVGRECPQCGGDTIGLVDRWLRRLSRAHPWAVLQRRWCLGCGWEGMVRLRRQPPGRRERAPAARAHSTHTLELRWLTLDGRQWRVLLQCWHHRGRFYGRLVFVGPSGRVWLDAVEGFSGSTRREVLGQALAVPDGLLANRLRRSVAEN